MTLPHIFLLREETGDQGTFGRIITPGFWLYSGELPWRDNRPNLSCISSGVYNVEWTYSPAFRREMYLLLGTAPRTGIREHPANFMGDRTKGLRSQLYGCIALGEKLGWMGGQKALLVSAPAVRRFEERMEHKPFTLEIAWRT